MTPVKRLPGKVAMGPNNCWIYMGSVTTRGGYGSFGIRKGVSMPAHRAAYRFLVGPIPDGMHLDHECHTRDLACPGGKCLHRRRVNPDHLAPVTSAENNRRSPHTIATVNGSKTHCVNGHEFNEKNTLRSLRNGSEQRACRECHRLKTRRRRERLRQAA